MAYLAKLEWGSRKFDLNDSTFSLGDGFVPPSTDYNLNIAEGTSANTLAGGEVVGQRALDRDWSFPVRILGASDAETHQAARQLRAFLSLAHDTRNTLYFCYKPNADYNFEPLWGQYGSFVRYEVKHADAPIGQQYSRGNASSPIYTRALIVNVNMLIGPHALGNKQRLGSATGGVLEDWIGTVDGQSRGPIVPEATTNKMTNPMFGHSTWNTDWTNAAQVIETENTDEDFILFGTSSARLVRTGAANDQYYQSINVGNVNAHEISFYAIKPDRSAVTASDIKVYYGGDENSSYINVGNGWYRVFASVTGVAAGTNTGAAVKTNAVAIYVDGFQIEEKAYATPFCYGDMLGCSWAGTAHDSTSTRVVARIRVEDDNIFSNGDFTIRAVIKANVASADFQGGAERVFEMDLANDMNVRYASGTTDFRFTDGTNTGNGANYTFVAGDIMVLHFTGDPANGLILYIDGASYATNATYIPQISANYMYLGSDEVPVQHATFTFLGFTTFNRAMSATEVSDDFDNITEWASGGDGLGQRVSEIPYLWTKDGDDVVDNCDDDNQDNWAVVSGIAGSVPARTLWEIAANTTPTGYFLLRSIQPQNNFFRPTGTGTGQYYQELDEIAAVGTTSNDSFLEGLNVAGADTLIAGYTIENANLFEGRTHLFIRIKRYDGTDTTVDVIPYYQYGAAPLIYGDRKTLVNYGDNWKIYYLNTLNIVHPIDLESYRKQILITILAYQSSTSGLDIDFFMAIPGDMLYIFADSCADNSYLRIVDYNAYGMMATDYTYRAMKTFGKKIELAPSKLNIVWFIQGADAGAHVTAQTATFNKVYITPRWNLL